MYSQNTMLLRIRITKYTTSLGQDHFKDEALEHDTPTILMRGGGRGSKSTWDCFSKNNS